MSQLSIDPVTNYYRVAQTLVGRILLFFAAGWCGIFLGRFSVGFQEFAQLLRPWEVMEGFFGGGLGFIGELLVMVFWPISTLNSSASVSIWLFFLTMGVMAITFAVFIYSDEPAPAWWLGLVGFSAVVHVIGNEDASAVSWTVLVTFVFGIGAALWWAIQVFHPELVESVGDLLRGRSSRPGYLSYAGRPEQKRDELRKPDGMSRLPTTRDRERSGRSEQ